MPIWTISLRFFSPPEKPTFTAPLQHVHVHPSSAAFSRASLRNSPAESSASPARPALGVERVAQELDVGDAGISTGYWKPRNSPAAARSSRLQREQVARRRR